MKKEKKTLKKIKCINRKNEGEKKGKNPQKQNQRKTNKSKTQNPKNQQFNMLMYVLHNALIFKIHVCFRRHKL